ncbi:MAG: ImmA/IrrE family metallo-endopeptidase [Devosiaceae bacterium]|nr:ImmA/IrrE family metallo-endopeptidase [Devosiaceae bacterium MH13]
MSDQSVEASPMSRAMIRNLAYQTRQLLGLQSQKFIDVEALIEFGMPRVMKGFVYDIQTIEFMKDNHGLAVPSERRVIYREDVYERALDGSGRDRATIVHELAHLFLHTPDRMVNRRADGPMKAYVDPEWQAKAFAGEFLVCAQHLQGMNTAETVANTFGVSESSARVQLGAFLKEGLIKKGQINDLAL